MINLKNRGVTLLVAITVAASLLLVSVGMVNLAIRKGFLISANRDSQFAFYAADTGIECAIYWDVKNPSGYSAFSTSTSSTIYCNQDTLNPNNPIPAVVGGPSSPLFTLTFLPDPYCARVTVTKFDDGATKIESRGYNTCDVTSPHRVERAVRVTY